MKDHEHRRDITKAAFDTQLAARPHRCWSPGHQPHTLLVRINSTPKGMTADFIIDGTRRTQIITQRPVCKASLTRMQTFIQTGDRKLHEIQVRFDELPNIINKF